MIDNIAVTNEEHIELHRKYKYYKGKCEDLDTEISKLKRDVNLLTEKLLNCCDKVNDLTYKVTDLSKREVLRGLQGPPGPPGECKCPIYI